MRCGRERRMPPMPCPRRWYRRGSALRAAGVDWVVLVAADGNLKRSLSLLAGCVSNVVYLDRCTVHSLFGSVRIAPTAPSSVYPQEPGTGLDTLVITWIRSGLCRNLPNR